MTTPPVSRARPADHNRPGRRVPLLGRTTRHRCRRTRGQRPTPPSRDPTRKRPGGEGGSGALEGAASPNGQCRLGERGAHCTATDARHGCVTDDGGHMRGGGRWLVIGIAIATSVALLVPEASAAADSGVTLSAASVAFGAQLAGVKSDASWVTLTNSGAAPLALSTFHLEGADAGDFSQSFDCPLGPDTLPVGGSCKVYVAFTPDGAGARSAQLVIGDDAPSGPQTVTLSGTGTTAPQLLPPVDFGLPAGTFFSDDFESGSLGRWDTLSSSDSTVTPDATVANSGSGSVRVSNGSGGQSSRVMADLARGGHAQSYTRFCFRVAPGQTDGVEIANGRAVNAEYPLGIRRWVIGYNPVTKGLEGYFFNEDLQRLDLYAGNGQVQTGRWYCAELYLDERADGHAQLWLDGTSIGAVAGDLSATSPYSRIYLWNQAGAG